MSVRKRERNVCEMMRKRWIRDRERVRVRGSEREIGERERRVREKQTNGCV